MESRAYGGRAGVWVFVAALWVASCSSAGGGPSGGGEAGAGGDANGAGDDARKADGHPSSPDGARADAHLDASADHTVAPACDGSCGTGKACKAATDCISGVCQGGSCKAPSPTDGVKNDSETDVDCGGQLTADGGTNEASDGAPTCANGKSCNLDGDCSSAVCSMGKCVAPTCSDHLKDGSETDVDCGGADCNACPTSDDCLLGSDCQTMVCARGPVLIDNLDSGVDATELDAAGGKLTCQPPTDHDGVKNDSETDVDCGGALLAPGMTNSASDGAPTCAVGKGCLIDADCTEGVCASGPVLVDNLDGGAEGGRTDGGTGKLTCQAPTDHDGVKNGGETGLDCGGGTAAGSDGAIPCGTGQGCLVGKDCVSLVCSSGAVIGAIPSSGAPVDCTNGPCTCQAPTAHDGVQNGDETDIDCGGASVTGSDHAPACATGGGCRISADCVSGGCNYLSQCASAISCTQQNGGYTCGPNGTDDCCRSLPATGLPAGTVPTSSVDKYTITAGRMRAFVTATGGDMRGWIAAHAPTWWDSSWTNFLPNELDDGNYGGPHCSSAGADCGVYQDFGPSGYGPAGGGNEGCVVTNYGARTYRLPDAINSNFGDVQEYTQEFSDVRSMNCVTAYVVAAFCAWDGGHLPTHQQIEYVWGTAKYPWGAGGSPPSVGGDPAGFLEANDTDPESTPGGPLSYSGIAWGSDLASNAPTVAYNATPPPTASQLKDLLWANYNYNYFGGATVLGTSTYADYTIFIAPPGSFPNGNGPYGHSDLAGHVFTIDGLTDDAANPNGANATACWSRSGSWQGHAIPWVASPASCGEQFPANYRYWAAGGRCAR